MSEEKQMSSEDTRRGRGFLLSGGGVTYDTPVTTNERQRLHVCVDDDPRHDLTILVENGALVVIGQYAPLRVMPFTSNRVAVQAEELSPPADRMSP